MAARRKLFITHAGELAHRLVRTARPEGLVARFARAYARRHGREGVVDEPARLREMESTVGREAVLVMVAEVQQLLPGVLGAGKRRPLGAQDAAFAEAFWREFLASLGRALEWPAADFDAERAAFERDLTMYRRWTQRAAPPAADGVPHSGISPFCERCALLLDPSMMEEARRAAAEFEGEVIGAATRIVGSLGLASRPAGKPPRRTRRPPRPRR